MSYIYFTMLLNDRDVSNYAYILNAFPDKREIITKAIEFIYEKHKHQKRKSGEPYVNHPIEVAKILVDMDMDLETVVAGLLHDTLEDTDTTYEEIESMFGKQVADIVNGVSKISKIKPKNMADPEVENYRKMLIAMSKDIRVIIVKLADRLHNMRTLHFLPKEKIIRIAKETMSIYAPIAHRLGMWDIKTELEDLCFMYLFPAEYEKVRKFVARSRESLETYIKKYIIPPIKKELDKTGIKADIKYRSKHLYSIWQKTIRKGIKLEDVHDILGVRIIVNEVRDCYVVLGIVHNIFKPVPGKFDDYISLPKPNLYQSLHTTVIGPKGRMVEIQIRTHEMHERAEKGIAAHWAYKEGKDPKINENFSWLQEIIENIKGSKNTADVINSIKENLFFEEVFVFTPAGDIVVLPAGATPVDFAYHIHTDIGNHCAGAKVNGRIVPLSYRLQQGDQVEILTHPHKKPNPQWLSFVVTSKAKNKIKQALNQEKKEKYKTQGVKLLEKLKEKFNMPVEDIIEIIKEKTRYVSEEDILINIAKGKLSIKQIINLLAPSEKKVKEEKPEGSLSIEDLKNVLYSVADCCKPVAGDKVYGVLTRLKGVVIHHEECPNLKYIKAKFPEKVLEVSWNAKGKFKARLKVLAKDRMGILSEITSVISEKGANIREAKAKSLTTGIALMDFIIDVRDKDHLNSIISAIREVENVEECDRVFT